MLEGEIEIQNFEFDIVHHLFFPVRAKLKKNESVWPLTDR